MKHHNGGDELVPTVAVAICLCPGHCACSDVVRKAGSSLRSGTLACLTGSVLDDQLAKLCLDAHWNAYTPGLQRKQVEGAKLDLEGGRVTYVPPTAHAGRGWSVALGSGAGQVARLVHVTGVFQAGRQFISVDSFAAVSAQGDCLGSFPTGLGQVAPSPLSGWFPPDEVRDVAARAGVP